MQSQTSRCLVKYRTKVLQIFTRLLCDIKNFVTFANSLQMSSNNLVKHLQDICSWGLTPVKRSVLFYSGVIPALHPSDVIFQLDDWWKESKGLAMVHVSLKTHTHTTRPHLFQSYSRMWFVFHTNLPCLKKNKKILGFRSYDLVEITVCIMK